MKRGCTGRLGCRAGARPLRARPRMPSSVAACLTCSLAYTQTPGRSGSSVKCRSLSAGNKDTETRRGVDVAECRCSQCKQAFDEPGGYSRCAKCREYFRGKARRYRQKNKLADKCTGCGQPNEGRVKCLRCTRANAVHSGCWRDRQTAAGLCNRCSRGVATPGYKTCSECRTAYRERWGANAPKLKYRPRLGRCTICLGSHGYGKCGLLP